MTQEEGFNVSGGWDIPDQTTVKEQKFVLEPCSNVRMLIKKVTTDSQNGWHNLKISFKLTDGLVVMSPDGPVVKYKNMTIPQYPQKITAAVDPTVLDAVYNDPTRTEKSKAWFRTSQYSVDFKKLLLACDIDPSLKDFRDAAGKVDMDNLIAALEGREIMANIVKVEDKAKDPETKKYTVPLGTYQNQVVGFRKVA